MSPQLMHDSNAERRSSPRVPLDAPYFVTVIKKEGGEAPALLVDCGRGGVQLAVSPGIDNVAAWLGLDVVVTGLPAPMDNQGLGCAGTVSWVSVERCGVRFYTPLVIDDDELMELVANL